VAGDIFKILVHQLRDQAFMIHTNQSKVLGESCMGDSDIIGKKFDMDLLISAPKNFFENAKREIERLTNDVQKLNKDDKILDESETLHPQQIQDLKKKQNTPEERKRTPKSKIKEPKKDHKKVNLQTILHSPLVFSSSTIIHHRLF
jgi:hypothetical protein